MSNQLTAKEIAKRARKWLSLNKYPDKRALERDIAIVADLNKVSADIATSLLLASHMSEAFEAALSAAKWDADDAMSQSRGYE